MDQKLQYKVILKEKGAPIGTADVETYASLQHVGQQWIFRNVAGGFEHYLCQLSSGLNGKVLIMNHIEIKPEKRRAGAGSAFCAKILDHFSSNLCCCGFLRIGTPSSESWPVGKVWREFFYHRLGWITMTNHPSNAGDVPIMWHPMKT